jgi:hypothetical protein
VVNGSEWFTDTEAEDFEENEFGGKNAVLIVEAN